jgi:Flp pilus assembly pilin Flp
MGDLLLKIWCSSASRVAQLQQNPRGATAVEYAIMVALIATVIIVVVKAIGGKSRNNFNSLNGAY